MLAKSAPIEGVERTNTVMVYSQWWAGFVPRCDPYSMDVDCGKNCYSCRKFRYLVKNCRNWEIVE